MTTIDSTHGPVIDGGQVEHFRTHGYLLSPRFFDGREVAAMQAEVARFQREGRLRNVATTGDGATPAADRENLQLIPLWHVSRLFRALPFADKVVAAVTALLGEPIAQQLDQLFLKPAGHGAATNWHTDNAYFKVDDPLMGTAMWIAIHDATVANGTLRVIPDAFRQPLEHVRDPESNHHIRCYPDESAAVTCELEAGGVVFFCYGTPHATGPNHTAHDRAGVGVHFLRTDHTPEHYRDGSPWGLMPRITGPEATGGEGEYGTRVAGTWAAEVARLAP